MENDNKTSLLKKLQSYRFAAYDMQLYLDTHPDDKKALKMFKDLVTKSKELVAEYEKTYGPLTATSQANMDEYKWINGPWPWEKEANA